MFLTTELSLQLPEGSVLASVETKDFHIRCLQQVVLECLAFF